MGVFRPESWAGAFNAVWESVQDVGSCYPAELLGVKAGDQPARPDSDRTLVKPGGLAAFYVIV